MINAIRRSSRAAVPVAVLAALAGCRYTTDPADMPVTGNWLGHIPRLDGGLAWEFRLHEDGLGNVSGTVSRTDFVRIPAPSETVSPGTVEGVHASSEVRLILDYGSYSEAYEGRFRSDDRIEGFIVRGTVVRNIGTLELRRIARGSDDTADGATIPANGGITSGN
ncbi:hypothetical protein [Candidatus Palauibacter sp.]|uniref:hypothetical protein n=1 Tax=Candidatus Palauibacter sp. TaxID=3101350 RepID=UPI003B023CB7